MRPDVEEVIEGADLINRYLLTSPLPAPFLLRFFNHHLRLQESEVRVVSLLEPIAGKASAAGKCTFQRLLAEQAVGKHLRQRKLSKPPLPDK